MAKVNSASFGPIEVLGIPRPTFGLILEEGRLLCSEQRELIMRTVLDDIQKRAQEAYVRETELLAQEQAGGEKYVSPLGLETDRRTAHLKRQVAQALLSGDQRILSLTPEQRVSLLVTTYGTSQMTVGDLYAQAGMLDTGVVEGVKNNEILLFGQDIETAIHKYMESTGNGSFLDPGLIEASEGIDPDKPLVVVFLGSNQRAVGYDELWATDTNTQPGETPVYSPSMDYPALNTLAERLSNDGIQVKVFITGDNPTKLPQVLLNPLSESFMLPFVKKAEAIALLKSVYKNYEGQNGGLLGIGFSWGYSLMVDVLDTVSEETNVPLLGSINLDGIDLYGMGPETEAPAGTPMHIDILQSQGYPISILGSPLFSVDLHGEPVETDISLHQTMMLPSENHSTITYNTEVLNLLYNRIVQLFSSGMNAQ